MTEETKTTEEVTKEAPPAEAQIRVSKEMYLVLNAYVENEARKSYMTMPSMASLLKMAKSQFDATVSVLKEREWLQGTKKITTTEAGRATHAEVKAFLEKRAAEAAPPEPVPPVPSAEPTPAAMPSQPPQRYNTPRPTQEMSLSEALAASLRVKPEDVFDVIKKNVISVGNGTPATNAEILQVMSVMHKYNLDPFVKQVYAFRHKGKLQISTAADGWTALANRQEKFRGVEYEMPEEMVKTKDGKMCWPWVKAICHIEGRVPTIKYAFLDEWYVGTAPGKEESNWAKFPCHRLQQKAYTLSIREAFGISLWDQADVEQFQVIDEAADYEVVENTAVQGASILLPEVE